MSPDDATAATPNEPVAPVESAVERAFRTLSFVRFGVLIFLTTGVFVLQDRIAPGYLLLLYILNVVISAVGFRPQYLPGLLRRYWPWVQIALDSIVVAVTIVFTDGSDSLFASLFIVVILEAGILLGMAQSFAVSTFAAGFMLVLMVFFQEEKRSDAAQIEAWYNFLVQVLAYYLTAFMAGYWSQRLRQMQAFQREILDNMNSGFLITDAHGIVSASNTAARALLHLGRNPIGLPVQQILVDDSDGECPVITTLRLGRDYTSYEFFARIGDNDRVLLGLTTSRMFDTRGTVTGAIASFTDLTEMDRMRREVLRQDRMAIIGELAAGLAHEIRNPVAVIRGAADEIGGHTENPDTEARLRRMVLRESDHLNEIVSGFLDFAREPELKREEIDLVSLIEDVREIALRENGSDSMDIVLDLQADAPNVSADPSQLKQVFVNLAKNAIESMEGSGTLRIVLTVQDDGPIQVRFEDEGPGIDPDKVARIFEPFYTTKSNGVGMGLAVCARIITAHDGTIRATSRTGGGCSMNVSLPALRSGDSHDH